MVYRFKICYIKFGMLPYNVTHPTFYYNNGENIILQWRRYNITSSNTLDT